MAASVVALTASPTIVDALRIAAATHPFATALLQEAAFVWGPPHLWLPLGHYTTRAQRLRDILSQARELCNSDAVAVDDIPLHEVPHVVVTAVAAALRRACDGHEEAVGSTLPPSCGCAGGRSVSPIVVQPGRRTAGLQELVTGALHAGTFGVCSSALKCTAVQGSTPVHLPDVMLVAIRRCGEGGKVHRGKVVCSAVTLRDSWGSTVVYEPIAVVGTTAGVCRHLDGASGDGSGPSSSGVLDAVVGDGVATRIIGGLPPNSATPPVDVLLVGGRAGSSINAVSGAVLDHEWGRRSFSAYAARQPSTMVACVVLQRAVGARGPGSDAVIGRRPPPCRPACTLLAPGSGGGEEPVVPQAMGTLPASPFALALMDEFELFSEPVLAVEEVEGPTMEEKSAPEVTDTAPAPASPPAGPSGQRSLLQVVGSPAKRRSLNVDGSGLAAAVAGPSAWDQPWSSPGRGAPAPATASASAAATQPSSGPSASYIAGALSAAGAAATSTFGPAATTAAPCVWCCHGQDGAFDLNRLDEHLLAAYLWGPNTAPCVRLLAVACVARAAQIGGRRLRVHDKCRRKLRHALCTDWQQLRACGYQPGWSGLAPDAGAYQSFGKTARGAPLLSLRNTDHLHKYFPDVEWPVCDGAGTEVGVGTGTEIGPEVGVGTGVDTEVGPKVAVGTGVDTGVSDALAGPRGPPGSEAVPYSLRLCPSGVDPPCAFPTSP